MRLTHHAAILTLFVSGPGCLPDDGCGAVGEPSIDQGVYGWVCGVDDKDLSNDWPLGTVQLQDSAGTAMKDVEPDEYGFFELSAEPGTYLLCELDYEDCADLSIPDGIVECSGSVGPPPVDWYGDSCTNALTE